MNKYDGTLERTQFSFKISFLKVFYFKLPLHSLWNKQRACSQATTAGFNTPRCDLNGLLIHKIYWKG